MTLFCSFIKGDLIGECLVSRRSCPGVGETEGREKCTRMHKNAGSLHRRRSRHSSGESGSGERARLVVGGCGCGSACG